MPFIVTTRRPCNVPAEHHGERVQCDGEIVVSRVAVATLEEARDLAVKIARGDGVPDLMGGLEASLSITTESGGTVDLPDGTVIEVEHVRTFGDLWERLPVGKQLVTDSLDRVSILAAYNAKQET